MGCFPSKYDADQYQSAQIVALQNQVHQLQQQLSAYQGGSAATAYAPPAVHAGGTSHPHNFERQPLQYAGVVLSRQATFPRDGQSHCNKGAVRP
jgi:microcystin-dependent protein